MTNPNCIITCQFDMTEYGRLFTYEALSNNTCTVTGYVGSETFSLLIPSTDPEGRSVIAIGDRAFAGHTALRTVTLPDSVETIGPCV